jgi:hypothetical protein
VATITLSEKQVFPDRGNSTYRPSTDIGLSLSLVQLKLAVGRIWKQWEIVSNVYPFLPKLTMNGQFIRDFIAAESPCFALGLVEERKQPCGFLALRPAEVIPPEISGLGFNFGHALLGATKFEVIQFVFHFYGFETYNMLVNPNNRLVKKVLMRMVESGDYFFFAIRGEDTKRNLKHVGYLFSLVKARRKLLT